MNEQDHLREAIDLMYQINGPEDQIDEWLYEIAQEFLEAGDKNLATITMALYSLRREPEETREAIANEVTYLSAFDTYTRTVEGALDYSE